MSMKHKNEIQAGMFISVCLLLFVAGIWTLGQERHIFSSQVEYYSIFKNIQGLSEGAPVRLGGITVGRVSNIDFTQEIKNPRIMVTLLIDANITKRIRDDSRVIIKTQGLLGDKFISISTGTSDIPVKAGSIIQSKELGDMGAILEQASVVVENTVEISESLNTFFKEFKTDTLDDISDSMAGLADILKNVKEGDGLAHDLIYSKDDGKDILGNLEKVSENLKEVTEEIKDGKGLLHSLIYDKKGKKTFAALTKAAHKLSETAEHISGLASEIKSGDGMLHDLIYAKTPEGLDDVIEKLNNTAANLEKASEALAKGSGTIGALLVDSQLYDNLVEVTDGAKRSFILRQAIKNSLKEDEKKED